MKVKAKTKKKVKKEYEFPRLTELGIPIHNTNPGFPGVNNEELDNALKNANLSVAQFSKLFGCQTFGNNGLYPWDVEAVLERMMSGRLIGTQLNWD
jgi:hypothetical protein